MSIMDIEASDEPIMSGPHEAIGLIEIKNIKLPKVVNSMTQDCKLFGEGLEAD